MSDSVFKGVEIVGTSSQSFSHAIEVAVARARKTLHNLSWFVVEEMRGGLQQERLQYQVTLRVFFKLDDIDEPSDAGEGGASDSGQEMTGGGNAAGSQTATKRGGAGKKGRSGGRR
jgi:flavin-binding protein dodecin